MLYPLMLRRYGAEFIGTFAYVFFGCGVKILEGNDSTMIARLAVYFTFGFTLFIISYSISHISAAPINPAVVFGLALARRFPWRYVWPYWVAQIAGAFAASSLLYVLLPGSESAAYYGATIPTVGIGQAIGIEAVITFFLMLVFMAASTDRRTNRTAMGLAAGVTITLGGLFAGPLTGGSMNPARSLAPAVFAGGQALTVAWIYWVGPIAGAVLGAIVYELLRGGEEHAIEAPEGILEAIKKHRLEREQRTKKGSLYK